MIRIPRIDAKDANGLIDKVVGLGKEIAGEAFDSDQLIESGEAQQNKGTEKLKAIRQQAKAESHEAKARAYQQKEKSAQRSKAG